MSSKMKTTGIQGMPGKEIPKERGGFCAQSVGRVVAVFTAGAVLGDGR
jgi:hypothetical protein